MHVQVKYTYLLHTKYIIFSTFVPHPIYKINSRLWEVKSKHFLVYNNLLTIPLYQILITILRLRSIQLFRHIDKNDSIFITLFLLRPQFTANTFKRINYSCAVIKDLQFCSEHEQFVWRMMVIIKHPCTDVHSSTDMSCCLST